MEEDENCDVCGGDHNTEVCPELGLDVAARAATQLSRARLTLPHNLDVEGDLASGTLEVVATYDITAKTQFGPYEAKRSTNDVNLDGYFALKVLSKDQASIVLDGCDENECNWLCLVQPAQNKEEQNCIAYQLGVNIFYNTTRLIRHGEKLRVWYATQYAKKLGKPVVPDGETKVMLGTDIGKLLSTPMKAVNPVPDEEIVGKRRRKVNAYVEEFLQSARKKPKVEIKDETTTPRRRGRPPKYAKPAPAPVSPKVPPKIKPNETSEISAEHDEDGPAEAVGEDDEHAGINEADTEAAVESGEVPDGDFKCTRCTKTFSSQADMVKHLRLHIKSSRPQGEPYRTLFCTECGKGFVNSSNLLRHMKIHGKQTKTISCSLCSYKTYRHDIMRNHMDALHDVAYKTPKVKELRGNYYVKKTGKRGRPRKYFKEDPDVEEKEETKEEQESVSPRRILPARHNRGKKMMEVLSPFKKKKTEDEESDVDVIEDSGSEAVVSDEEESEDENIFEEDGEEMKKASGEKVEAKPGEEEGEVTIPDGETLTVLREEGSSEVDAENQTAASATTSTTNSEEVTAEATPVAEKEINEVDVTGHTDTNENVPDAGDDAPPDATASGDALAEGDVTENVEPQQQEEAPVKRKRGRPKKSEANEPAPLRPDLYDIFLTQDDRTIYGCKECGKKFQNLKYIRMHSVVHAKKYSCEKCGKSFAKAESCDRHVCDSDKPIVVKVVSGESVRFNCTACEKSFANEDYARQHYTIHSGTFDCEVCKQPFHSKLGLLTHKCNKEAAERKNFACDICSQAFRTSSYLFRHMAMHTDIFKCNICGKCFSRKDSLQRHVLKCDPVRALEEDLHACVNCHKAFSSKMALENHLLVCSKTYCFKCKQIFQTEEECLNHSCDQTIAANVATVIDATARVRCRHCSKTFRNFKYLKRHEEVHNGTFQCKICTKKFSRKEELLWHIVQCENEEKIKTDGFVKCDLCEDPVVFTDTKGFRDHHLTHTHPYQCEKCLKRFRKQGTIHTHVCDPYQYQEGGFKCPQCDKTFSLRSYMEKHAVIHGDRLFECEVCSKRFFRQDYINDHKCLLADGTPARIVRRHNQVIIKENVVCHLCGASFVSSSNLNKHLKTHGEKQYECDICGKKFHYLAYMKDHRFHVHGRGLELQCAMCGKILKTRTSLKSHIHHFHSGLEPQHECSVCHKRFRQKGNLKTHMYSHSTEKQFHCTICNKSFKYPDQYARHQLEHTMKDKFTCELCKRQFVKRFEYRKHLAVFHSGMAYVCSICKSKCSHRHTLQRHFRRKHPGAVHMLSDEAYIRSLMTPFQREGGRKHIIAKERTDGSFVLGESDAETDAIAAADAAAEVIASAALASETTNAPTMSIGQTFTNELGETFTESVITDADGVETTIVYQTPEGFTAETDLPQVAAEALQSLSHTIVNSEDMSTTLQLSDIQGGELAMDDQHTVVIVQIVNQDEETELGETYTISQE